MVDDHPQVPTSSTPIRVRVRSKRACDSCRSRKRKCDGSHPCAECVGYGYDCDYTKERKRPRRDSDEGQDGRNSRGGRHPTKSDSGPADNRNGDVADKPLVIPDAVAQQSAQTNAPMWEPYKSRFIAAHSAIAFARNVGVDLKMERPPRLHSYAWSSGVRPERPMPVQPKLASLLSFEGALPFINIFFDVVSPVFGFLKRETLIPQAQSFWMVGNTIEFEAVLCGVLALGSIFSSDPLLPSLFENELFDQARIILETNISIPPAQPTLNHVQAWILRVLYLRLTTRPHMSWMASCTTLHMAEAVGLHSEIEQVRFATEQTLRPFEQEYILTRRRTFWVAWALNKHLSAEYGRSRVDLDYMRCSHLTPPSSSASPDHTHEFIALAELLPDNFSKALDPNIGLEILASIERLPSVPNPSSFSRLPILTLLQTDICLMLFRRLRLTPVRPDKQHVSILLSTIENSLPAVLQLTNQGLPWWCILSTPFQAVLTLVLINSAESVAMIPPAMKVLMEVASRYDTHLAREAVRTAKALIRQSLKRKRDEMSSLEELLGEHVEGSVYSADGSSQRDDLTPYATLFEGLTDDNLGWTTFSGLGSLFQVDGMAGLNQVGIDAGQGGIG